MHTVNWELCRACSQKTRSLVENAYVRHLPSFRIAQVFRALFPQAVTSLKLAGTNLVLLLLFVGEETGDENGTPFLDSQITHE